MKSCFHIFYFYICIVLNKGKQTTNLLSLSSAVAIAMALFFMDMTFIFTVISFLILLVITYVDNKKISLFKITILTVLTGLISIKVRVIEDIKYSKLTNTLLYAFVIIGGCALMLV